MKSRYRNILIGTAIAAVFGVTGTAIAHGGSYGGHGQQGAPAQQGCDGTSPGMGMGGMGTMGSGGMMDGQSMGMMGSGGMMGGQGMGMMGSGGMMGGQGMGMMGSDNMKGGMGRGFGLDLSDEQKTEMGKIRADMLPKMGELRGKMQANHEQLRVLIQSDSADQASVTQLAEQKGDLIAEMIKLRFQHRARMKALLTEEQREGMHQRRKGMGMMSMPQTDG